MLTWAGRAVAIAYPCWCVCLCLCACVHVHVHVRMRMRVLLCLSACSIRSRRVAPGKSKNMQDLHRVAIEAKTGSSAAVRNGPFACADGEISGVRACMSWIFGISVPFIEIQFVKSRCRRVTRSDPLAGFQRSPHPVDDRPSYTERTARKWPDRGTAYQRYRRSKKC
jgi:hypothetical protein